MPIKLQQMDDLEVYQLLKQETEKEAAFKELYSRHSARVFAYCKRILSDQEAAEDIFQDTFLSFLKSAEQDREMTNVPAFLLRIARNLCLNKKREKRKYHISIDDIDLGYNDNVFENKEISELIARAMDLLPDEFREAIVLQTYNGMSYNEIAEFCNVPMTTVRNWIARGKRKLKEILEPYFEIPQNLK